MTILHGALVRLRPLTTADRSRVREILATPEVSRWWGDPDREADDLVDEDDEDITVYAIEFGGETVGVMQSVEDNDLQYRQAGIDIAVHADWHGRGIGSDAIRTLARHLFASGHHRLTIDPSAANEVAIRVYRGLGFRPVGILRQYELGTDGTYHDGLLMDLLVGELTERAV
ncbi:GNAT family N-acetyltransferase [Amycolatopsis sp. NPDC059021]|uniref:GNAT family N-acetyltransferase n=1 Tax=Amycolatopsis sp. NPDC059021 TaxID=3346704 RepID=UPI00366FEFD5